MNTENLCKRLCEPKTVEQVLAQAEERVRTGARRQAVQMSFTGTLRVGPNKIYVSPQEGRAALEALRRLPRPRR